MQPKSNHLPENLNQTPHSIETAGVFTQTLKPGFILVIEWRS
jgi:hypothetical protein